MYFHEVDIFTTLPASLENLVYCAAARTKKLWISSSFGSVILWHLLYGTWHTLFQRS